MVDRGRRQYFHVVSRVAGRGLLFGEEEKAQFVRMMRQQEGFSGLVVLAYCVMSNHFHLLVEVPAAEDLEEMSREEIRGRMRHIYSREKLGEFDEILKERREAGDDAYEEEFYQRIRSRMHDLSAFTRELKLRFSKWFNAKHERVGTLWESRFRCVLVEGSENALMSIAAYIELNPVRAGIVTESGTYRWCSLADAMSGGKRARAAVIRLVAGRGLPRPWKESIRCYRDVFQLREAAATGGVSLQGRNGPGKAFMARVRFFSEGLVMGTREFIDEFFKGHIDQLHSGRKKLATKLGEPEWGDLYSYRNVSKG